MGDLTKFAVKLLKATAKGAKAFGSEMITPEKSTCKCGKPKNPKYPLCYECYKKRKK